MGQVRVGYLGVGRLVVKSCWGHAREARYIEKKLNTFEKYYLLCTTTF